MYTRIKSHRASVYMVTRLYRRRIKTKVRKAAQHDASIAKENAMQLAQWHAKDLIDSCRLMLYPLTIGWSMARISKRRLEALNLQFRV